MDTESQLIFEETRAANLHDLVVSLVKEGEVYVFRDKGYSGCNDLPVGTVDYTLHKDVRGTSRSTGTRPWRACSVSSIMV